ncbi:uncharacterized protein ACHE_20967S [Aspergillus chevalieri]|uniref:Uncharacterized protein n=1 Tax=Aspergillus chevalieri TaxID=182096 RepID=A0A7R7VKJ0_ASPCH|nr:uncharacterized protein ACHE_20967S [Aspergillus chevalieri]BCR85509.1 hypothetical protein ACHE_20967S [Aspergillus chevalieri]
MCQSSPSFPSSALLLSAGCLANSSFPSSTATPEPIDSGLNDRTAVVSSPAAFALTETRISSTDAWLRGSSEVGESVWLGVLVGVLGPS